MPNWCRNVLIVGSEEKMGVLVRSHCPIDKESGVAELDFNTIKRMPDELRIERGSRSFDGLRLFFTRLDPAVDYYGEKRVKLSPDKFAKFQSEMAKHCWNGNSTMSLTEEEFRALRERYKDGLGEVEKIGRKCVENARKYGAMDWYEWSTKNWGTKWNASNTSIDGSEMSFDTAWNPAIPAMVELSRLHPTIPMALLFADEDIGVHTGFALMTGGKIDESGTFGDDSIDAYKLAFKCWGCEKDYRFDARRNTYVLKDF